MLQLAVGSVAVMATIVAIRSTTLMAICSCAGEQRKRDYDWSTARIDPASHRFGRSSGKGQQCSVKQVGAEQCTSKAGCFYDQL